MWCLRCEVFCQSQARFSPPPHPSLFLSTIHRVNEWITKFVNPACVPHVGCSTSSHLHRQNRMVKLISQCICWETPQLKQCRAAPIWLHVSDRSVILPDSRTVIYWFCFDYWPGPLNNKPCCLHLILMPGSINSFMTVWDFQMRVELWVIRPKANGISTRQHYHI